MIIAILLLALGLLCTSCAKKPSNNYYQKKQSILNTKPTSFSSFYNVSRSYNDGEVLLQWNITSNRNIDGIAVYRFEQGGFIPHVPVALLNSSAREWSDQSTKKHSYALAAYAFMQDGTKFFGPVCVVE